MRYVYLILFCTLAPVLVIGQHFFVMEQEVGYERVELTAFDTYFRTLGREVVDGYRAHRTFDDFVLVRSRVNGRDVLETYDRNLRRLGRESFNYIKKYSAQEDVILIIEVDPYTGREYLITYSPSLRYYARMELDPDITSIRLSNGFIMIGRGDRYDRFRSLVQVYDKYLRLLGKKQVGS